jgi:hypothetical protein
MKTRFQPLLLLLAGVIVSPLRAWDYEGHRTVNQLALAALPKDFPAFVHDSSNAERIAFLAGEPDRWRNVPDLPLKQSGGSWDDHFLDMEQLPAAGLDLATLTSFRYDFIVQFAAGRAAHPENFRPIDPKRNADHTAEWPGFAPWAITEYFGKLRSGFSYLKAFQNFGGTAEEITNAQADIIYIMGIMGHYVGDCAQPLHTTLYHNGWIGENPNGYTTWPGFHSWIDGGFFLKAGIKIQELLPRIKVAEPVGLGVRPDGRDPVFVATLDYLIAQNKLVEPLYQLEKAGKFSNELEKAGKFNQDTQPVNEEGRAFIEGQLLKGGEMLATLWTTAWRGAGPDQYLQGQLVKRQAQAAGAPQK